MAAGSRDGPKHIPIEAAKIVGTLSQQALDIHVRLRQIDRELLVWHRGNDVAKRLADDPGDRAGLRHSTCRLGHRPASVPLRTAVRRLAGPDAAYSIPAAAKSGSGGSPRWATNICAGFSSSA